LGLGFGFGFGLGLGWRWRNVNGSRGDNDTTTSGRKLGENLVAHPLSPAAPSRCHPPKLRPQQQQ